MEKKYSWTEGAMQYDLLDQSSPEIQELLCSSKNCYKVLRLFFVHFCPSVFSPVNPVHSNAFMGRTNYISVDKIYEISR